MKRSVSREKKKKKEAFGQDILLLSWLEQICFQEAWAAFPAEDSWAEEFVPWTLR